jgi:hypothetical protein
LGAGSVVNSVTKAPVPIVTGPALAAGRSALTRGLIFGSKLLGTAATVAWGIQTLHDATAEYAGKTLKQRRGSINDARRKAWNDERARLGLPPLGSSSGRGADYFSSVDAEPLISPGATDTAPGGFKPGPLGPYKEVPVHIQDAAQEFGDAGGRAGSAYRTGVLGELDKLDAEVSGKIQSIIGKLSFTARPTITPNVTPTDSPSLQRSSANVRAAQKDFGIA